MRRDLGAIVWPDIKGGRVGTVSPAEGQAIGNRAVLLSSLGALASRAILPGTYGSTAAWIVFPAVFLLVSLAGRSYYLHRGATRPGRVLLVEDDPATASAMERHLRRRGWDVDSAPTLALARDMLAYEPAWVLLDVMLPDGSGLDLFRLLRSGPNRPRTIVLTAAGGGGVLQEIQAVRPTHVVYKPIQDVSALLDSLGDPFEH